MPRNDINRILYFTAQVEARAPDLDLPIRQSTYLRALRTLPRVEVHLGTFLNSTVRALVVECDATGQPLRINGRPVVKRRPSGAVQMEWVFKTEEKGSDVNLASHLLRDAYRRDMQCAVVVSNNSDLLTPIKMVKADCGLVVGLVTPRRHGSVELRRTTDFQKDVRKHQLANAQFPLTLNDAAGVISKPPAWR